MHVNRNLFKIVFLSTSLNFGGAETQLTHLASRLKARDWQVSIISITPPLSFVEELQEIGVSVNSLGITRKNPGAIIKGYLKMVRMLRLLRPHILHCHMVHANLLGRTARLSCNAPVLISTVHNIYEGGRIREIAYRITDPLTDLTTFVSGAAAERYVGIGAVSKNKPWVVVPNGVDMNEFIPNPEMRASLRRNLGIDDRFVWLAVGRLEEQKNYPNVIRAFAEVIQGYPNAALLIVGDGNLRSELELLTERLGLNNSIHFLGVRRDVPGLMNAADAHVLSSDWEGMPMVLLEASASGLPIIATDVGGNREIVLDGNSGILVAPRDSDALSNAMRRMISLPVIELRRMGEAGRNQVKQQYDIEHVVDVWEGLYTKLLREKGLIS
jgi:glycosyltransferase involved in cell wall biosynthesis